MSDELDRDRIPPDPATLITALAGALADVHLGRSGHGAVGDVGLIALDHGRAADLVCAAVSEGWVPSLSSPYHRAGASTVAEVVANGVTDVERRAGSPTVTIGRATVANLVPAVTDGLLDVGTTPNITFRRATSTSTDRPSFAAWSDAASADPYRDLALAAADVIAAFGPGAVLGFVAAYSAANPSIEPIDPIRLDWWTMVTAVIGTSASLGRGGLAAS